MHNFTATESANTLSVNALTGDSTKSDYTFSKYLAKEEKYK